MIIKIPEVLNDITLYQWQQINAIDDNVDSSFYTRRVLNIIYGIRDLNKYKSRDLDMMMDSVKTVLNSTPKFEQRFTLHDVDYGFIPNLDDISFGEFVDLDKYSEVKDYHKLMSILYRPVTKEQSGDRYSIDGYMGSNEKLRYMPLGISLGAIGFFLTLGEQLMNDTLNSLTEEEVAKVKKSDLLKSGDGTLHYFRSQTITS